LALQGLLHAQVLHCLCSCSHATHNNEAFSKQEQHSTAWHSTARHGTALCDLPLPEHLWSTTVQDCAKQPLAQHSMAEYSSKLHLDMHLNVAQDNPQR